MWDEPRQLNLLSRGLLLFSLLLLLAGAARYVLMQPWFPLQTVELVSAPKQVTREEVERVLRTAVRGNFFLADIARVRAEFEKLPWVRKASVRRHFPWGLAVELEEHVALARWGELELVNTHGEIYQVESMPEVAEIAALPWFAGPPERAGEIARMYGELQPLLKPLRQDIAVLSLSPRYAWQVKLNNGLELKLGREDMAQRLARFVAVYPYSLAAWGGTVKQVDLRYRNGFAVYAPGGLPAGLDIGNRV